MSRVRISSSAPWHTRDVHRFPRGSARLLRRPGARQHQVVLGVPQARLRRVRARPDAGADRGAGRGVRGRQGLPALPRRALRQGQDALQEPPGRVRHRRPGDRVVRRGRRSRRPGRRRLLPRRRPRPGPHPGRHRHRPLRRELERIVRPADPRRLRGARRAAQDHTPRVLRRPPADRPAAPQVAVVGTVLRLRAVIHTPELLDRVRDDWRALRPLVEWISARVEQLPTSR